ncbi:MAG: A/G-specific adenine glycosylase [Cucumibacter sp.]
MPHIARAIKPATSPTIDAGALLAWYGRHARDFPWRIGPPQRAGGVRPDPYAVWLSEIMLQQTTVATVRAFFEKFVSRWSSVADLAAARREEVLAAWAGLGYYARARNLHACAAKVTRDHGGVFPKTAAELATLPGIGPYTSAAIAAICFDEPVAVVDGNVERVVARLVGLLRPVREVKSEIRAVVEAAIPARAGDFAQALMDLGATICAPKIAHCPICPLRPDCVARASGQPLAFPVAPAKRPRPRKFGHAFVMTRRDGAVWLTQRPEKGLLAAMTGTPGSEWGAARAAPSFPAKAAWQQADEVSHVFTHFALTLTVWRARVTKAPKGEGWWSRRGKLAGEALPTLYKKVLEEAGATIRHAR